MFLFGVALWFVLGGALCFGVFPCSLSSCFAIPFSIVITLLGEEGVGLCAFRAFLFIYFFFFLSFFSSSWCRGLAAVCYYGTAWTFLFEPPHDKTNNVAMRPAKTEISMGVRPV